MSVNDVPRDSFGRVHLDAPPDYSATCSNNGEHSGQAFGQSVMTADLVNEKSKICPLNSSYIARNENDTENHEVFQCVLKITRVLKGYKSFHDDLNTYYI